MLKTSLLCLVVLYLPSPLYGFIAAPPTLFRVYNPPKEKPLEATIATLESSQDELNQTVNTLTSLVKQALAKEDTLSNAMIALVKQSSKEVSEVKKGMGQIAEQVKNLTSELSILATESKERSQHEEAKQETKQADTMDGCSVSQGYIPVSVPRLCFKLIKQLGSWSYGQRLCKGDGGRLIILNTEAKHDYISKYLIDVGDGTYNAFVGMRKVNGVFKWTDGTDYVKVWDDGEPDYVSYQKCGALWTNGLGDIGCGNARRIICEIVVPE